MLGRFPAVDGIVLDAGMPDMPCATLVGKLRQMQPTLPLIVIGTPARQGCAGADYFEASFEPAKLLGLLGRLVPGVGTISDEEIALSVQTQ